LAWSKSDLELDLRAERAHALDLQRARVVGGEDGDLDPALAARVGHALAEVAGGRADDGLRLGAEAVQDVIGAAALEAADRVDRFDLEHGGDSGAIAERLADKLRRVEEGGVDDARRFFDSGDGDAGVHGVGG